MATTAQNTPSLERIVLIRKSIRAEDRSQEQVVNAYNEKGLIMASLADVYAAIPTVSYRTLMCMTHDLWLPLFLAGTGVLYERDSSYGTIIQHSGSIVVEPEQKRINIPYLRNKKLNPDDLSTATLDFLHVLLGTNDDADTILKNLKKLECIAPKRSIFINTLLHSQRNNRDDLFVPVVLGHYHGDFVINCASFPSVGGASREAAYK